MTHKDMRATAAKGRLTLQEQAKRRTADLKPILAGIQSGGATSLQQIARGGSWSKTQVARMLDRVA